MSSSVSDDNGQSRGTSHHPVLEKALAALSGSAQVLIVEDNPTIQHMALAILSKFGIAADVAVDGREALKALASRHYDLVLMDMQMPVLDGLATTRIIRDPSSQVLNHHVPIIAMTANASDSDRDLCLDAGMDSFIAKPATARVLADILDFWLPDGIEDQAETPGSDPHDPPFPESGHNPVPALPVFDRAGMLSRLMGDTGLVNEVVRGYLTDIPKQIDALRNCLVDGDWPKARRQAHTMVGASANVGAAQLVDRALELETLADTGDRAGCTACLEIFELELQAFRDAVQAY